MSYPIEHAKFWTYHCARWPHLLARKEVHAQGQAKRLSLGGTRFWPCFAALFDLLRVDKR